MTRRLVSLRDHKEPDRLRLRSTLSDLMLVGSEWCQLFGNGGRVYTVMVSHVHGIFLFNVTNEHVMFPGPRGRRVDEWDLALTAADIAHVCGTEPTDDLARVIKRALEFSPDHPLLGVVRASEARATAIAALAKGD
jgi:hypothetical protein